MCLLCLQPEELIERLEMCEFYELDAEEKLEILLALCHRLMASYSVQDYMEEKQRHAAELWYVIVLFHVILMFSSAKKSFSTYPLRVN